MARYGFPTALTALALTLGLPGCGGEPAGEPSPGPATKAEVPKRAIEEGGPAAKVEPAPKVEPKAEPKVEPKAEPKVEPKAEPKVEPKGQPVPDGEPLQLEGPKAPKS